jgi:hypothetical protein
MSVKLKRFHANESNFSRGGRMRTEVQIPASLGVVDLTASKVILDMHMELKAGSTDVLLPVTFGNQQQVGAHSLIRNTAIISESNGILNERRNRNVIDSNHLWYLKSRSQEDQLSLLGNSTNANYGLDRMNLLPDNPFIVYKKPSALTGASAAVSEAAVTHRTEIPIDWSCVDAFGPMPQFPQMAVGNTTLRLEFEDQIATAFPARMPFSAGEPADNRSAVGSLLGAVGAPLTLTKTTANYFRAPQQGDIVAAYFIQTTTGSGSYKYPAATGANSSGLDEIASVTTAGGKYVVTLKNGFTTTAASEACTGITLFYCSASEMLGNGLFPLPLDAAITGAAGDVFGSAAAPIIFSKNAVGGIQTSKFDDAVTLDSLQTIPWIVGAPVTLAGVGGTSSTVVRHETTIASVTVNGDDVEIVLTTPYDGTAIGATNLVQVSLTYRDSLAATKFTCNWVIDEVYAEMHQIQLTPQQMAKAKTAMANMEIPWVDQQLVQRNMPDSTAHTEVLQAMAGTIGLSVLTPQNLTLLSGFDGCNRYRFSINGKEVSNQDIIVGSADVKGRQIHNYFLKTFFANLGLSLKKYDAPQYDYDCTADKATHSMYPLIVPNMASESVVQIQLFSDSSMASKNIFYVFFRQRVMKISNGRVMLSA